jgi:hypothetical protein
MPAVPAMKSHCFSALAAVLTLTISALTTPKGHCGVPPPSGNSPRPLTESGGEPFEVSLSYAYLHLGSGADLDHLHGVDTSAFANVTRFLGLGAEFTAAFGSDDVKGRFVRSFHIDDNRYIYLFGPRLNLWPTDKIRIFGQLLAGGFHVDLKNTNGGFVQRFSGDAFAYSIGVGADWRFTPHWYWRVIQAEYVHMNFTHQEDNWKFSTGLVFAFGGRK